MRAEIAFTLTESEYVAAAKIAARRTRAAIPPFRPYAALFSPDTLRFFEDWLELSGEQFWRRESYALFDGLVETSSLFVFWHKDGSFIALPKRALPAEDERVFSFLRNTFARKYRRGI
ncbi:MAG: YcxB family protein [Clostridia bacterium]|nr:YcxB family protein [Clostridia bacterium]